MSEPTTERRERTSINEAALEQTYATYDSDPRVHGPDDYDAFRAGITAYLSALPEPSEAQTVVRALVEYARSHRVEPTDIDFIERVAHDYGEPITFVGGRTIFRQAKGGAS